MVLFLQLGLLGKPSTMACGLMMDGRSLDMCIPLKFLGAGI